MESSPSHVRAPDASVVVVTHDNEALINRCLSAVASASSEHELEVIVVDNASTDRTVEIARTEGLADVVLTLAYNTGFASAANRGIEAGRGRTIVLVNSDAFPDVGSIDKLIAALDAIPTAGIAGARLRYADGSPQPSAGPFPSLRGGLWVALLLHRAPLLGRAGLGLFADRALYRRARRVDWVTAAFCAARREVCPLPSRTFMYGEDVWWGLRTAERGFGVWLEPAATAVHLGRASVAASQPSGFAQRSRVTFELDWFAARGTAALIAARAVLALHALVRLAVHGGSALLLRRGDSRLREDAVLLRASLTPRSNRSRCTHY